MQLLLNPPTATACTYAEGGKPCKEAPVGELRSHFYRQRSGGKPWLMCERHLQPEMHPRDLRDKLHRWETAEEATR